MEVLNNTSMLWRIPFRGTVHAGVQCQTLLVPTVLESLQDDMNMGLQSIMQCLTWWMNNCFISSSPPTQGQTMFFLSFVVFPLKIYLKNRVGCAHLRFSSVCVPTHVIFVNFMKVTLNSYFFRYAVCCICLMICLYRAFPVWKFPIHVQILRSWMTSRPNFGLKKNLKNKKTPASRFWKSSDEKPWFFLIGLKFRVQIKRFCFVFCGAPAVHNFWRCYICNIGPRLEQLIESRMGSCVCRSIRYVDSINPLTNLDSYVCVHVNNTSSEQLVETVHHLVSGGVSKSCLPFCRGLLVDVVV
jgi:hypothetical protein